MQPKTHTIQVGTQKVRTRTPRRFIVVTFRSDYFEDATGTYVPFARVDKRTDSIATARKMETYHGRHVWSVVYDTEKGEVI